MPYIAVNSSKVLDEQQKDALKTALGEKISLISGKAEKTLMVDIADGRAMYFRGEKCDAAYLDVKAFGAAAAEEKKAFVEAAFDVMVQAGFEKKNVYITFSEFASWGVNGSLKP